MSYSSSANPISYKGYEISRISRIVFKIPFWGILEFGATFGVFAKSDVILLLGDPDFL